MIKKIKDILSGFSKQEEVDSEDIAEIVSHWTGVQVQKMIESEKEKLLHLSDHLHLRVVGQDEAISAVSDAVIPVGRTEHNGYHCAIGPRSLLRASYRDR